MQKQKIIYPSEKQEQVAFVQWLRIKRIKHSSIPNSTWTPSPNQKVQNENMGLCPGLPDLMIFIPAENCTLEKSILLFCEMKKIKSGKVSDEQNAWITRLNRVQDIEAKVCFGFDEAVAFVTKYLK